MDLRHDPRPDSPLARREPTNGPRPVVASDDCPVCRCAEVATLENLSGYAHARIEGGRLVWLGETDVDWNGSETARTPEGIVLACLWCGHEWVHPALKFGP